MTSRDFDLLREIYQEIKDLRTELLAGHEKNEQRITVLENYQHNLMGKIGVGVLVVGTIVSAGISLVVVWIKERI